MSRSLLLRHVFIHQTFKVNRAGLWSIVYLIRMFICRDIKFGDIVVWMFLCPFLCFLCLFLLLFPGNFICLENQIGLRRLQCPCNLIPLLNLIKYILAIPIQKHILDSSWKHREYLSQRVDVQKVFRDGSDQDCSGSNSEFMVLGR